MFLFYAYGAGLGHLNRINNFIYTQKIPLEECVILTNSSFVSYLPKPITVIHKKEVFFRNKSTCNTFIENYIKTHRISTLVVDVFPAGFYGEFEEGFHHFQNVTTLLLARILKDVYFKIYTIPKYDKIYSIEEGVALEYYSAEEKIPFHLEIKPTSSKKNDSKQCKKPFFLIMHSSPIEEVLLLYKQALLYRTNEDIYIYTFVNSLPIYLEKNTYLIKEEKTSDFLLENADKIFTGCGFNSILETKKYRRKQYIIPFKRRYDDQFKRKYILDSKNF